MAASDLSPIPVIMGPTASGKTALSLALAEAIGGEIVSADSMQVYRVLNIGTAKASSVERVRIRHHLIDILDISEALTAHRFVTLADAAICEIRSRDKIPIIVGGTGMYLRGLLYGFDPLPADSELRRELEEQYGGAGGVEALCSRMREEDPEDLSAWDGNPRHLLRSFEIFLLSGEAACRQRDAWHRRGTRFPVIARRLVWPRETLKERIAARCQQMLESGWIDEAAELLADGLLETPTARQALGYALIGEFLEGRLSHTELTERIITATWQYARRQETWFRGQHPEARELFMPAPMEELVAGFQLT